MVGDVIVVYQRVLEISTRRAATNDHARQRIPEDCLNFPLWHSIFVMASWGAHLVLNTHFLEHRAKRCVDWLCVGPTNLHSAGELLILQRSHQGQQLLLQVGLIH